MRVALTRGSLRGAALVVYIGGGIVEVVAMQGEAIAAAVILLAALLELSLLWLLLRARGRPAPRG